MYSDFLIYGKNEEEPNIALARVLQRAEDCGLTCCAKKFKYSQKKMNYFGLVFAGVWANPRKVYTIKTATEQKKAKKIYLSSAWQVR